jgi:hypothetical protein
MRALMLLPMLALSSTALRADAQARPCPAPSALDSALRARAVQIITDSAYAEMRSDLGITQGDTSSVSIVSSTDLCEGVTRGLDAASLKAARPTSLAVVRFQTFYAAAAPERGRIEAVYIFDDTYHLKTTLGGW